MRKRGRECTRKGGEGKTNNERERHTQGERGNGQERKERGEKEGEKEQGKGERRDNKKLKAERRTHK